MPTNADPRTAALDDALARACALLAKARHVAVLTGAGVSAESGIPTFRDALTGLWARFRPEELATPEAFAANPRLVWDWYAWRREQLGLVAPNAGHAALVALERRVERFALITQNVDGLHARAGSHNVIELHGNLMEDRCFEEGCVVAPADQLPGTPPRCPRCGALLRPGVVWFGEALPADALERAYAAAADCDVFVSIGTSTVVEPAASLPFIALEAGAAVIEVNTEPTRLSPRATVVLEGRSGVVLPQLVAATAKTTADPS